MYKFSLLVCRIERKWDALWWKLGKKKRKLEGYQRWLHNQKQKYDI